MIEQMLERYEIVSEDDLSNALKEIFQEIALLGLYRGGFFQKAVFYGGTSLRILYGLNRFSEDLDFSLTQKDEAFDLQDYFLSIEREFEAFGIEVSIRKKNKSAISHITSAFLKNDTSIYNLILGDMKHLGLKRELKIKLEVDTHPPLGFESEAKTLLYPISFNIQAMTLPSLFAGKMHVLLFRKWKNRVKGRDWFDFEWYIKKGVGLDLRHLENRMRESGDYCGECLSEVELRAMFLERIERLDIQKALDEVSVFLKDRDILQCWSKEYFELLSSRLKIYNE